MILAIVAMSYDELQKKAEEEEEAEEKAIRVRQDMSKKSNVTYSNLGSRGSSVSEAK